MPMQEQITKLKENSKKGWVLEVDLEYLEELHEAHNSYPLAPEKKAIRVEEMSEYQKRMPSIARTCSFISARGCI